MHAGAVFGCAGANDDKSDGGPEDDWAPLTEAQIEEFKELFASETDVMDETTGEYRYTTSTPVSCFFTSHYDDPRDIDLADFLRYCPLSTTLGDADVEEFHAVLDTLGIEDAERFKVPDDWAVPVRRIPKSDVSALLTQWADITVDDLCNQDGVTYLAQYDAFYEFASDFGPGSFIPMGGEQYGDSIRLWSAPRGEDGEGTHDELTLEVRPDGSYEVVTAGGGGHGEGGYSLSRKRVSPFYALPHGEEISRACAEQFANGFVKPFPESLWQHKHRSPMRATANA